MILPQGAGKTAGTKGTAVSPGHAMPEGLPLGLGLKASFLLVALLILMTFHDDPGLNTFALIFVSIVLEALPFILLGAMISGFVEVFLSKERLAGMLPRKRVLLTLFAAGMGAVFPVCECGIVPVVRRFLRKGIPLSAAVAYLLAGPVFNPVVGASTFVAYSSSAGWQTATVVAIRLSSGFAVAFAIGLIMGKLFPGASAFPGRAAEGRGRDGAGHTHRHEGGPGKGFTGERVLHAIDHGVEDFLDVTQYLVMGAFVAGLLQTLVSRQVFIDLAAIPLAAIPLMMLLAFVLNLCSEADAFVAASFRGILPLSAQMAFLVLGPMLDIKLILMYLGVFRKRTIVVLAALVIVLVFALMVLLHGMLGPWYRQVATPGGLGS